MPYRVWNVINPPHPATRIPVETPEEGARLINMMAELQLEDPDVFCNAFGLEVLCEDGSWEDWYDENGDDVDALADSLLPESTP